MKYIKGYEISIGRLLFSEGRGEKIIGYFFEIFWVFGVGEDTLFRFVFYLFMFDFSCYAVCYAHK